jgi:Ca-activated chloride channel family protein
LRGLGILSVTKAAAPVVLPLAGVEISARVAERIAEVTVTQVFHNPHTEPLEAVYIFPLPGGAAVSSFELKVGSRVLRGRVEERGEARRQYREALDQGHRAALLEQERDDVFTIQVGNLPPGEEVTVRLTYSERLPFFEDGATELRLPLVVAPRYIPGTPLGSDAVGDGVEDDTDVVPDASRISPPRLVPGFDPKVALSVAVELLQSSTDGAEDIVQDLCCSQHAIRTRTETGSTRVMLAQTDERLDRDFVLRWRLAHETVRSTLLVYRDEQGDAYGMLSIIPPRREGFLGVARDVVFVLDRSGSMTGVKMASAARACSLLLATLGPRDRFAIQAFDNVTEWLKPDRTAGESDYWLCADEAGIALGEQFLRGITARGGTELDAALGEALKAIATRRNVDGRVPVVVLLTDGEVGDEARVLKCIQKELSDARVFTVGIDTAVNEGFLKRLAALGGGTATFVEPGAQLEEALRSVGREIGNPLVVDMAVVGEDEGLNLSSIAPSRIPDLFAGRATTTFFRLKKLGRVRVRGRHADSGSFEEVLEGQEITMPALAHLWAKARIMDLEDRFRIEPQAKEELRRQIVELSARHGLLTRFTAYVVVDESEVVNADGSRRKIVQPVEMPARWEMEEDRPITLAAAPSMMPTPMYKAQVAPDLEAGDTHLDMEAKLQQVRSGKKQGWLGRIADTLSDALHKDDRQPSKSASTKEEATKRAEIAKALDALMRTVAAARTEVEAGRVPSADPLEHARTTLLQALAESDLGVRLPELQRFLRTAVIELIAALRTPGITTAALRTLFDRHAPAFEKVRAEADHYFVRGPSDRGNDDPFWESGV